MVQTIRSYLKLALTLICQGHLFRTHYQKWMILSWFREITSVHMAKHGLVIAMADFVTQLHWSCHLKVKMIRNFQNNIRNYFNVPKSVELDVLHSHVYTLNDKTHNGRRRPYLIWPWRNSWRSGKQAPRWFCMSRDPLTWFKWEMPPTHFCKRVQDYHGVRYCQQFVGRPDMYWQPMQLFQ